MVVYWKPAFLIGAVLLSLMLALVLTSRVILLESFAGVEKKQARVNVQRVLAALDDELAAFARSAGDYAAWDDTWDFVRRPDPEYVRKNLIEPTFIELKLNLIVFVDKSGRTVFARAFDREKGTNAEIPEIFRNGLPVGDILLRHETPDSGRSGLLILPQNPMLVVSRPILPSNKKGPIRGALIMGRLLDSREVARLATITHLAIDIRKPGDIGNSPDFQSALSALSKNNLIHTTMVLDSNSIAGYSVLRDIYGRKALMLKAAMPRDVYRQGLRTIRYFLLWIFAVALFFSALTYHFLAKFLSSRENLKESEQFTRSTLEALPEHIAILDEDGTVIAMNRHWRDFYNSGVPLIGHVAVGANYLRACDDVQPAAAEYAAAFAAGVRAVISGEKDSFSMEYPSQSLSEELWFLGRVNRFAVRGPVRVVVAHENISGLKKAENNIHRLAYYDSLTGLPNRVLLLDSLRQAISVAERNRCMLAVMFLDLDYFKVINDTLGHSAGDSLLKSVASRLKGQLRRCDIVSRTGGDEFVIILNEIRSSEVVPHIAGKILESLSPPFQLDAQEVFITTSIGIAFFPDDGGDEDRLLKNADTAMYQAKERGRNNYQFFSSEMNLRTEERLSMQTSLRHALEREEFMIHYQPWLDMKSGRITGMEALARWRNPKMGLVMPEKFIPIAEETGLIIPIGEWVLKTACAELKAMLDAGCEALRLSVNLTGRQLRKYQLVEAVTGILAETGVSPRFLELELTESSIMENTGEVARLMHAIRGLGVELSVDDFGTGYSSLNYLKSFPINKLKIDQSFIRGIPNDKDDTSITLAIIALARSLKLKVIAEGVETEEQMKFLKEHGCDEIQGFYVTHPLPADEAGKFISEYNSKSVNFTPA